MRQNLECAPGTMLWISDRSDTLVEAVQLIAACSFEAT